MYVALNVHVVIVRSVLDFRKDSLNGDILIGHNELVVLYLDIASDDLPLLESIAFLGGSGEGYLFAVQSLFLVGGSFAVTVGGNFDAALLDEDNSDNNISVGHDKLVVRYLYAALYDLPLLEAEALIGSSGEGYLGVFNGCLCGCGCSAVFIGRHSDAVRDGIGVGSRGQYRKLKDSIICISRVVGVIHEQILCRAVQTGFATDCNAATAGSVIGMMKGISAVGREWTDPIHGKLDTQIFGVGKVNIDDRIELTLKHIGKIIHVFLNLFSIASFLQSS